MQLARLCYAVNRDLPALELTRSVIADQGLSDPSFLIMLDGLASGQAMAPETSLPGRAARPDAGAAEPADEW